MDKVFCIECKHFKNTGYISDPGRDYCKHPENKINKYHWCYKWFRTKRHPKKINKYNNCSWYEAV